MRYRKCYDLREMWYNLMLMLNSFYCIRSCYNGIIAVSTCPVLPEMHVKFIYQRTVIVVVALPESTYLPCACGTRQNHENSRQTPLPCAADGNTPTANSCDGKASFAVCFISDAWQRSLPCVFLTPPRVHTRGQGHGGQPPPTPFSPVKRPSRHAASQDKHMLRRRRPLPRSPVPPIKTTRPMTPQRTPSSSFRVDRSHRWS